MILSMLFAHLMGDYVLQWDKLAAWKSRALAGVLVHGLVITTVTVAMAFLFDPEWLWGALLISGVHILVDAAQLPLTGRPTRSGTLALTRFTLDQVIHFVTIFLVLSWGGYLSLETFQADLWMEMSRWPILAVVTAYTLLAMPAWVTLEFMTSGLVNGSPPDFGQATNKYVSSMERWLMTTCVLLGQFLLVPLVALPRFLFERGTLKDSRQINLYTAKLLGSAGLAVGIGLALRMLW